MTVLSCLVVLSRRYLSCQIWLGCLACFALACLSWSCLAVCLALPCLGRQQASQGRRPSAASTKAGGRPLRPPALVGFLFRLVWGPGKAKTSRNHRQHKPSRPKQNKTRSPGHTNDFFFINQSFLQNNGFGYFWGFGPGGGGVK